MVNSLYTSDNLDVLMSSGLVESLEPEILLELQTLLNSSPHNAKQLEATLEKAFRSLDWQKDRPVIVRLFNNLLPLEYLLPEFYYDWKPVFKDLVSYIVKRLNPDRLIPKLIEQITRHNIPLEQRLVLFITRMRCLQKLGQVIARNRHLHPKVQKQLATLENSIRDVSFHSIQSSIHQELGELLEQHSIVIDKLIHSEASVAAIIKFSWINPESNQQEDGILKVLKPYIKSHFEEEINILQEFAEQFDQHSHDTLLKNVSLGNLFKDIRELLEKEMDFRHEQKNLISAAKMYQLEQGAHVPILTPELCSDNITAMSFENGIKVTDALPRLGAELKSKELAIKLIEELIALPFFSSEKNSLFHADPHAGNLLYNSNTEELVIIDWALTEKLDRSTREQTSALVWGILLRDRKLILDSIKTLSLSEIPYDSKPEQAVNRLINDYLNTCNPLTIPTLENILTFVDKLGLEGIKFPTALLMFRKSLLTLDGIIKCIHNPAQIETVIYFFVIKKWARRVSVIDWPEIYPMNFDLLLNQPQFLRIIQSIPWYGIRTLLSSIPTGAKHTG